MTVQTMSLDTPVGRIVLDYPQTRPLFDKLRIDYPCGGSLSLAQAARLAGIDPESILNQMEGNLNGAASPIAEMPLADLCFHIVSVHHAWLKDEVPGLKCLFCKVRPNCSKTHIPMFKRLTDQFETILTNLDLHMVRQERTLFPEIAKLECAAAGRCLENNDAAQSITASIEQFKRLHQNTINALSEIRDLTEDYSWIDASNPAFQTLYDRLAAFEDDLHLHIHYENNLLFPKTLLLFGAVYSDRS